MNNLFSLEKKVIAITGGYGHLGAAMSEGLAEHGATVIVLARDKNKFEQQFQGFGNISFQPCDISDTSSIGAALSNIIKHHHKLDVLINNAFYSSGQDPERMSDEDWQTGIDGSLNSVYKCIREALPYLKSSHGKIINVSSMYGVVAPDFEIYNDAPQFLNPPHYGAAKAGVIQLTKYFASYLGKDGINVNAVSPGAFPNHEVQKNNAFVQALEKKNPLGRIGQPQDLKGALIFLSSEAANYITGQNLIVDGGWTIW